MAKYKIGDKVRIVKSNGMLSGIYVGRETEITGIIDRKDVKYPYSLGSIPINWCDEELELIKPMEKTFENLEAGDVVVDTDGEEAKVIDVLPNSFLRSCWGTFDQTWGWHTKKQAQRYGWKIKGAEEEVDKDTQDAIKLLKDNGYTITKENK